MRWQLEKFEPLQVTLEQIDLLLFPANDQNLRTKRFPITRLTRGCLPLVMKNNLYSKFLYQFRNRMSFFNMPHFMG